MPKLRSTWRALLEVRPTATDHAPGWAFPAICAVVALGWLLIVSVVAPYVADDAYILFRHVQNFDRGLGFVWDAWHPVEGHSSPLWAWLCALGLEAGAQLPQLAVALGAMLTASAVGLLARILDRSCSRPVTVAALVFFASSPPVATWATAGLETPLALLAALLFVSAIGPTWSAPGNGWLMVLLGVCFAGAAIRPDLPLQLGAALLALSLLPGAPRRRLIAAILSIVAGAATLAAWRLAVYGEPVPLPQVAKGVIDPLGPLRYVRYLLLEGPQLVGAGLLLLGAFLLRPRPLRAVEWAALALAGAMIGEHALLGGDELVRGRFTVLPLALLLVPLTPLVSETLERPARAAASALLLALVCVWQGSYALSRPDDAICGDERRALGQWLHANSDPHLRIAVSAAGNIPFYSELDTLDLFGLAHPDIARLEVLRASVRYGEEAAAIAHREGSQLFVMTSCGEGVKEACSDFTPRHLLMVGVSRYLLSTGDYALAYLRVAEDTRVPVLVRKDSLALAGPLDVCGEVILPDPKETQALERTDTLGRLRRVAERLWRRIAGGS